MILFVREVLAQNLSVPNTPASTSGSWLSRGVVPECALKRGGADTLECGIELFVNIADILLGVVGVVFLAVLAYGGLMWLTARGDMGKVKKATTMLWSSFIGLLIVFGAYSAVSFGVQSLRGDTGLVEIPGEYKTCRSTTEFMTMKDSSGREIVVGKSINEGEACGPGFQCRDGVCCDEEEIKRTGTCVTSADKSENLQGENYDRIIIEDEIPTPLDEIIIEEDAP